MVRVVIEELIVGDVVREHIIGGKVATVKSEEKVAEPRIIFALSEGIENWVEKKLAEVINTVGN
jgi:hypothetical protein